ncbi:hypothetical protein AB0C52_12495 [Streptomyces sp. NPDC048717]|uniref:hypothetical protein n=1 Tax=Streptomyces sp. NPDC048717 TaxID=3154928 RepID=UPI0034480853
MRKWAVRLGWGIPLGVLIVLVTRLAREWGGLYEVLIPPAFATGSGALIGNWVKWRRSRAGEDR